MKGFDQARTILAQLGGHAGLITLAVTALSTFTNIMLFSRWGISYVVVATPSDVLTGSIATLSLVIAPAIFLPFAYKSALDFRKSWSDRKSILRVRTIVRFIATVMMLVLISSVFIIISGIYRGVAPDGILWINYVAATAVLFLLVLAGKGTFRSHFIAFFACAGSMYLAGVAVFAASPRWPMVVLTSDTRCPESEHLVWAGNSYLVTACSPPPYRMGSKFHVIDRDGAQLVLSSKTMEDR